MEPIGIAGILVAMTAGAAASAFVGGEAPDALDDVDTPADTIHPDIHDKVGDGSNANPNGANDNGGEIHGIGNVPGRGGYNPNDAGVNGQANELETMHGGIGAYNPNA